MRRLPLLLAIALAGCGAATADPPRRSPAAVEISGFRFRPAVETVHAGETVHWQNRGVTLHNVRGVGSFSRAIRPGASWSRRFTGAGTYRYVCTLHPAMRGAIVVVR